MESNLLRTVLKPPKKPILPKKNNMSSFSNLNFSPLHWQDYFEEARDLNVSKSKGTFRVYLNGFKRQSTAPVLVLIHGGGYSALTWSLFVRSIIEICECRIIAIDLRGHGSTRTEDDYELSLDRLVDDIYNVLVCLFNEDNDKTIERIEDKNDQNAIMDDIQYKPIEEQISLPALCLVGHSLGGSIVTNASFKLSSICTITGLIVIDVVEGTALDALQSMHLVLKNRQNSFNSIRDAIEWCVRNNQTKNIEAARISFPGQIKNRFTNKTATDEFEDADKQGTFLNENPQLTPEQSSESLNRCTISGYSIAEEDEELDRAQSTDFKPISKDYLEGKYVWRINLFKSEPYWKSWFENLSKLFLSAPTNGRLLLLAGIDRLDKDLTIGQMQGKFQMQVLPQCGHAVHEDVPDKVAEAIATYLIRNKLVQKKKEFDQTFPCC